MVQRRQLTEKALFTPCCHFGCRVICFCLHDHALVLLLSVILRNISNTFSVQKYIIVHLHEDNMPEKISVLYSQSIKVSRKVTSEQLSLQA